VIAPPIQFPDGSGRLLALKVKSASPLKNTFGAPNCGIYEAARGRSCLAIASGAHSRRSPRAVLYHPRPSYLHSRAIGRLEVTEDIEVRIRELRAQGLGTTQVQNLNRPTGACRCHVACLQGARVVVPRGAPAGASWRPSKVLWQRPCMVCDV